MIDIKNLHIWYPEAKTPAIENLNFSVAEGEAIAIIGPNGCGKTTLGYCLCGIIPHLLKGRMEGQIIINGNDVKNCKLEDTIRSVGYIFQDPDAQFVTLRVRDELVFGLENIGIPDSEIDERIKELVDDFNISHLWDKEPQNLSMGEKQRVILASVIALEPNILLFDEPTSNLDLRGKKEFLKVVNKFKAKGFTIILFTHDFELAKNVADRIIVLHNKTIKFDGSKDLLSSNEIHRLFEIDAKKQEQVNPPEIPIQIIESKNISYRHNKANRMSLKGISFTINQGEILGLVGPNGSGKTTLLYILNGLIKPNSGDIITMGENIAHINFKDFSKMQGIVFQNPNHQIFGSSIREELEFGLKNINLSDKEINERINYVSSIIKYDDFERDPHELSYGQRKLLSIATVLAMKPQIILVDEPELGVDIGGISKIKNILLDLNKQGTTLVISSHNLDFIEEIAHRVLFLVDGEVKDVGLTENIMGPIHDFFDR